MIVDNTIPGYSIHVRPSEDYVDFGVYRDTDRCFHGTVYTKTGDCVWFTETITLPYKTYSDFVALSQCLYRCFQLADYYS